MICRVSKKSILELLIENKRCISGNLIFKVFEFICRQEDFFFQFNDGWRKKIKSTLVSLDISWKRILMNKNLQRKFLQKISGQCVEFDLKTINSLTEDRMDNDFTLKSKTLDCLLKNLSIN